MRPRYLLIAGSGPAARSEVLGQVARRSGLEPAFMQPRLAAFVNRACPCLAVGETGVVLGTLFHRHGPARAIASLDTADAAAIRDSRGDKLLTAFWGGYVAAFAGSARVRILRDPSAALPCYFATGPGCIAFASDVELLLENGFAAIDLDWPALARHFFSARVPTVETALGGICELLPGFAIEIGDDVGCQSPCWSPWDHVGDRDCGSGPSPEALARVVRHCVRAWSAGRERLLLSLSGGLDSSIVASGLAGADAETICLTMFGEDPNGDERTFARAMAGHSGFPLHERAYRLDDIDVDQPLGAHLPRPKDRTQALAYERAHLDVAQEIGATAFITGNGGDSVFGYSQSAASIADLYLHNGIGPGLLGALRDVCAQTGCGALQAAASAWRLARGPPGYRCRPTPLFLHPDVLAALSGIELQHPWLNAPPGALPGKAAHIASILRIQQCLESSRSRYLPVLNPLTSQPVVETCLAVPSWEWRAGGRDRSLARRAFENELPAAVLGRRIKGGPDGFAAQILDRYRDSIRERLLEGQLARQRIIDRDRLEQVLKDERPCLGEERVRILEFVAAEAWLESWLSRAKANMARAGSDVRGTPLARSVS